MPTKIRSHISPKIWNKKIPDTQMENFKKRIEKKYSKKFESYWNLHKWSIQNFPDFWAEIWDYLGIVHSKIYEQVYTKTGPGFLDCKWFTGARFNFAENLLRIRDDRLAIIHADETGFEEYITFSELFEEVKLYSAAFRQHGLVKGDRIACYMSNRKEAVYAFLAATSIGAVFGGPQPYYAAGPAKNIIRKMEPKFLICIDHHIDQNIVYNNINHLPEIVDSAPSLEKVIIIASRESTRYKDLTNINNSYLLEDFLDSGRSANGEVPELQFEQLPFDHPICINFTSGTTGLPKGPVHSAGSLLSHLMNVVLYWNLKPGDRIHTSYPVGWTLWDTFVPCLAWGVTLFLYEGNPYTRLGLSLFDVLHQYKVTYAFLATSIVEKLNKMNAKPRPESTMENLKILTMGGSPVKAQNCLYLQEKVKKDLFVASQYGASETFGTFSGFDFNLPCYAGEVQAPGLGMDVQCYDEEGNSVVNKRGELVLATPTPSLPIYIWKDDDNSVMEETYLSKYPGVWCQNDEIWINPQTKGIVVIGRSDDTIIQNGDRFGAGDIYFAIHDITEIQDAICVGQTRPTDGECRAVLFVKMKNGYIFSPEFRKKVEQIIASILWFDCVPEVILEVKDIPYNINNKKLESVVRKIVATNIIPVVNNIRNPECLQFYCDRPELIHFYKEN